MHVETKGENSSCFLEAHPSNKEAEEVLEDLGRNAGLCIFN